MGRFADKGVGGGQSLPPSRPSRASSDRRPDWHATIASDNHLIMCRGIDGLTLSTLAGERYLLKILLDDLEGLNSGMWNLFQRRSYSIMETFLLNHRVSEFCE